LHYVATFNIKGESYRLKERWRAGLMQNMPLPTARGKYRMMSIPISVITGQNTSTLTQ